MGVWSLNIFVCPEGSKGILTDLTFCVLTMLQCSKIFKCLISLKISSSFISPAILLEVESNYLQFKTFQQPLLKVINIDYIKTFQSKFRCGIINIYFKQIKKKRNYFDLWYIFNSNMSNGLFEFLRKCQTWLSSLHWILRLSVVYSDLLNYFN